MTRVRAWAARALLEAAGLAGAAGPRLASLCARAADALTWAAERVAPLADCPGCGAAVPSLDLEVVGVCGECAEREAVAPAGDPLGPIVAAFLDALDASADLPRVNVPTSRNGALN